MPPKPTLAIYREAPIPKAGEIRKVLCGGCAHQEPDYHGSRCVRMSDYEPDPVTGKAILTKRADCRTINAKLDCVHFEPRRSWWARFLDWL